MTHSLPSILEIEFTALMIRSMLLIGLTIFTGISWLGLMDRTGALTIALYERLHKISLNVWDRYQDKRQLKSEKRKIQVWN